MFLKDPSAILDYEVDWSGHVREGVAIADSHWTVDPIEAGGLEILSNARDSAISTVRLGGGMAGHLYRVSNALSLSDGSVDERMLVVRVEER